MPVDLSTFAAPARTAVLTLEMQNGIVGRDAGEGSALAAVAMESGVIANAARLVTAARAAGVRVVHGVKTERADGAGGSLNTPLWIRAVRMGRPPLVPGSERSAVIPELGVDERDIVVPRMHGISAFSGTELDAVLRNLKVETLVLTGVSVNVGVITACSEGVSRGYNVVVPTDAVAGFPAEYVAMVMEHTIAAMATRTRVDDLIAAWATPGP
jgi:nicotinamidase-related amidase